MMATLAAGCDSELADEAILDGLDCDDPIETVLEDGSPAELCYGEEGLQEDEFGRVVIGGVIGSRCVNARECKRIACPSAYHVSVRSCRKDRQVAVTECYCFYN